MYKYLGKVGVVILYLYSLQFADARQISSSDLNSIDNSGENVVDNIDYNEGSKEDVCELSDMPPAPDSNCCGIDVSTTDRILGGSPTLIKQYPWMALIMLEDPTTHRLYSLCAGSLISGRYVLTAGHCVSEVFDFTSDGEGLKYLKPNSVILGDYDIQNLGPDCVIEENGGKTCNDGEVWISIAKVTVHESYNPITSENDIALIKLEEMASYTDFIRPICLPTSDLNTISHNNLRLWVAGWGVMKQEKVANSTEYTQEVSTLKRHLQVHIVPLQQCRLKFSKVTENQICTAGGVKGQNACMGDSGGPLMYNNDGQFELVGVVNYGKPVCAEGPAVNAKVYRYYNWIRNLIEKGD